MKQWQMAWRNLMRRKLRTFLTVMSIIIGVASTFGVLASVESAKKVFPLYLKAAFGKADYAILGTDAFFSEEVLGDVQEVKNTESVAALQQTTELYWEGENITAIQKRIDLKGYSRLDTSITNFHVVEGDLSANGAVITDRTAKVWKVSVGDPVSLDINDEIREVPITAIVKYTVELMGPSSWVMAKYHPWSVAVPLPLIQEWFDLEGKIEGIQIKVLPGADGSQVEHELDHLVEHDGNVYMQPVILDVDSQFKDANTFFLALYIAGFLGIALSAFVIFNSLYVSIQERKNEFAALKTIGYTPGQLRGLVLFEVVLMSVIGTAIGLLLGFGLAHVLRAVIFMLFGIHDASSGMELARGLIVSVLAGVMVPILASLYPVRQAGKVSVIAVLKEGRSEKASLGRWQLVLGLGLMVCGFFIKNLMMVLPLLIGIVLVFPHLFKGTVHALKPVYKFLFGFSGEIATRNLLRNLMRTSMTSVILSLGIAMIVLMSSLNSALIQSYERVIHASYGGNLDIMFHHIEPTDLEVLKSTEGVADAQTYPLQAVVWELDEKKRKLPVYGVGEEWIDRFPLFTVEGKSPSDVIGNLKEHEVVLDKIAFGIWGGSVGENITLDTLNGMQSFTVVATVETMKNSGYAAFMSEDRFRESIGMKYERNALVIKDEITSPLQLRENIFDQFGVRIEEMFGPEDWVSVIGATLTGSFSVINFLIILAIIISGIGITNTLLMSIMERIREIGMMRAVGVTRRQVVGMILLEGFGIGLTATFIGSLFGILLIFMTSTFFEFNSLTYQFGVSWLILMLVSLFGIVVSLISSFSPASRAAKTPLSEALRYE
ncbi:ABC transporter permease [Paenibacillus sp. TRM 82003]|nr:ABC transporter permease [Paenibacillus sp. TRM 82003]